VCVCVFVCMRCVYIFCVMCGVIYIYVHPVYWRTTRGVSEQTKRSMKRFGTLDSADTLCVECACFILGHNCFGSLHARGLHIIAATCHRNLSPSVPFSPFFCFILLALKNVFDNNNAFRGTTIACFFSSLLNRNYLNHAGDTRKSYASSSYLLALLRVYLLIRFYLRNTNIPSCSIYLLGTLHMCQYDSQA